MRRRSLLVALAPLAALSLALPPGASAAPVQVPLDLSQAFDTDCTQEQGAEIVTGSCQGGYFAESFIASSFLSGTVTLRKQTFKMGDPALLAKNAANGAGQVVTAPNQAGFKYLQVLCAQVTGGSKKLGGTATITYADNSSQTLPLATYDWGGSAHAAVWSGPIQGALHTPDGSSKSNLFIEQLPLDPKKAVASIKLPTFNGLRIFAMTLSSTPSTATGPVFS